MSHCSPSGMPFYIIGMAISRASLPYPHQLNQTVQPQLIINHLLIPFQACHVEILTAGSCKALFHCALVDNNFPVLTTSLAYCPLSAKPLWDHDLNT